MTVDTLADILRRLDRVERLLARFGSGNSPEYQSLREELKKEERFYSAPAKNHWRAVAQAAIVLPQEQKRKE